jgi:hypothetical protein
MTSPEANDGVSVRRFAFTGQRRTSSTFVSSKFAKWTPHEGPDFMRKQLLESASVPMAKPPQELLGSPGGGERLRRSATSPGSPSPVSDSDETGLQAFRPDSYLAPLVPMVRAKDSEIRRQAICALANLTDEHHRPAVAALRDRHGRSVLSDLLQYTRRGSGTEPQRHEAVVGLSNLLCSSTTHDALVDAGLLPELLQLVRTLAQASLGHRPLDHASTPPARLRPPPPPLPPPLPPPRSRRTTTTTTTRSAPPCTPSPACAPTRRSRRPCCRPASCRSS